MCDGSQESTVTNTSVNVNGSPNHEHQLWVEELTCTYYPSLDHGQEQGLSRDHGFVMVYLEILTLPFSCN